MATDEVKPKVEYPGWKWYSGVMPAVGWDAAFLGPDDLMEHHEKYEKVIPIRALGKLHVPDNAEPGKRQMHLLRTFPGQFGCQDFTSKGVIDRKAFAWIFEATPAAADDWTKTWTEETVAESEILVDPNVDPATLRAMAQNKAKMARELRGAK